MTDALTVIRHSDRPTVTLPGGAAYQPIIGDDTGAGMPIRTGIQTSQPGYATPPHSHPYAEILTVLEGEGEAWLGRRSRAGARCHHRRAGEPGACIQGRRRSAARDLWHPHLREEDRQLRLSAGVG